MAAHRAAILTQAGKLFRRHGIDGVAVADITGAAGLTHGAFYGHFASKSALAADACRSSLEQAAANWRQRAAAAKVAGADPIAALIDAYLTPERRDQPDTSCMLVALAPEASRDPQLRVAMADGVNALIAVLEELIARRRTDGGDATQVPIDHATTGHASSGHARAGPGATDHGRAEFAPTEHATFDPAAIEAADLLPAPLSPAEAALAALAAMSGGLTLARTLAGDADRSDAVLRSAAALAKRAAA